VFSVAGSGGRALGFLLALAGVVLPVHAQPSAEVLAQQVQRVMQSEQVPGVSVAVWHQGEIVLQRGFGVAQVGRAGAVDADTLFKIGSATKAFTAAALAILVDEGKLAWDSRVAELLPGFALADPWVTAEFRVEDLLTHRSGLGLGAGDLMLWPQPNHFSRRDIVQNLRYLPLPGRFRADYAYDNLLYIVAGEVIAAVSGMPYEDFVQRRLLAPAQLDDCHAGPVPAAARDNLAAPHLLDAGQVVVDLPNLAATTDIVSAAAGGMHCSAAALLTWLRTLLDGGVTPAGRRLLSEASRDRLWQPVTLMPLSAQRAERDHSHFYTYALGWRVQDMFGRRVIHHSGSLSGMYAWTAMVPELDLAIVVLTNRSSGLARSALSYSLLMPYLTDEPTDWLAYFRRETAPAPGEPAAPTVPEPGIALAQDALVGRYVDPWFGEARIERSPAGLRWRALKSPRLLGTLEQAQPGVWRLNWDDRSLYADAWLIPFCHATGAAGFHLQPQSPDIDFSYDFQDLEFLPVDTAQSAPCTHRGAPPTPVE
jgi:CubicO group peptidase (beta-lactamase class C family)